MFVAYSRLPLWRTLTDIINDKDIRITMKRSDSGFKVRSIFKKGKEKDALKHCLLK